MMPVVDPLFAELPAQLHQLAVPIRRKVDQPLERALELDAHAVEAQHRFEQLFLGALDRIARLLLALALLALGARPPHGVLRHPAVSVLFDHYEEDWRKLWWVRVEGSARILGDEAEAQRAIDLLVGRYEQYRRARPGGPAVAISIERMTGWSPG